MTYPGGKNGCGSYQRIINHMPPHTTYIEPFLGSGAVLRNKRPAERNIAIDRSPAALALCVQLDSGRTPHHWHLGCGIAYLETTTFHGGELIYCDPPYLMQTRKSGPLYEHELSEADHRCLLRVLRALPCMVMISGYRSAMYDALLAHWHRVDYRTMTRQGMVDEALWMNFDTPNQLHDYSHLGADFRERERIKRKKARWAGKLRKMDRLERLAVMDALTSLDPPP